MKPSKEARAAAREVVRAWAHGASEQEEEDVAKAIDASSRAFAERAVVAYADMVVANGIPTNTRTEQQWIAKAVAEAERDE